MVERIEVISKIGDARAKLKKQRLLEAGFAVEDLKLVDVYSTDQDFSNEELNRMKEMLVNPVTQTILDNGKSQNQFDHAIEIGFLPGVTDNVGNTVREIAEDAFNKPILGQGIYSSQLMFVKGNLSPADAKKIGLEFSNPVIQREIVKGFTQYIADMGMDKVAPKVNLTDLPKADLVDILNADDLELQRIGKMGIYLDDHELTQKEYDQFVSNNKNNPLKSGDFFANDGRFFVKSRGGPLAMDLQYMKTVQDYFRKKGRNPFDIELESIAQTWSEHCKHTIFADPIDEFEEGLFKRFIRGATEKIRREKRDKDFCISVFSDNAGGIVFDEDFMVCHKVETHNSPSALDPFGGSITGIVGVNRDPMGFGMGSKPTINIYGFCFADPKVDIVLYKDKELKQKMLSSKRIMNGVIDGVNVGGNCSGIPTPQGFSYFDECYRGKPLIFVGTVGLIPREQDGIKMHEKQALPGDYIVMVGGRVGGDGIHGATFSSEAIDSGSPAGAVQIGDPITQKKESDMLIKEARDRKLYRSITDNGAGGLSCSVAEMAKESGGCLVYLDKVPLKYPGLQPKYIWISESQERMTLSVPKDKWDEFNDLALRRGVEATVIGEFTSSGKCLVDYDGKNVMDVDLEFLHNGLPQRPIKTSYVPKVHNDPEIPILEDLTNTLHSMLKRQNIASNEFISRQYDHEVQGGSVLKPLQGKGRVNAPATVVRPRLDSNKAVVLSQSLNPRYSEIDTYHMAASSIDNAIRNAVCAGADLEHLALLDNFCWCSSNDPQKLGELLRACQACYDYSVIFGTPFISGKDSMFNDFKGYDENGEEVNISVQPTLLISTIGKIEDARKTVSIDTKAPGDLVYVLGKTNNDELGGSEYFGMFGEIGINVPKVNAIQNKATYRALQDTIEEELISSCMSVERGGLGIALAKTAIAGQLGMDLDLTDVPVVSVPENKSRNDYNLFSESQGRVVVTISPENRERFESILDSRQINYGHIGFVTADERFSIKNYQGLEFEESPILTTIPELTKSYRETFKGY